MNADRINVSAHKIISARTAMSDLFFSEQSFEDVLSKVDGANTEQEVFEAAMQVWQENVPFSKLNRAQDLLGRTSNTYDFSSVSVRDLQNKTVKMLQTKQSYRRPYSAGSRDFHFVQPKRSEDSWFRGAVHDQNHDVQHTLQSMRGHRILKDTQQGRMA